MAVPQAMRQCACTAQKTVQPGIRSLHAGLFFLCVLFFLVWSALFAGELLTPLTEPALVGAEKKYGGNARSRLVAWMQLIAQNSQVAEPEKLHLVNDFFNRIPFVADDIHWGRVDYWATPAEMLASNGGDCEDFSIGKYFTLLALGVEIDRLKITYVKAHTYPVDQAHMVLTYYRTPDAIPLVLDNLIPAIKPATQRHDLTPVYAFNGHGLWIAKERSLGRVASGPSNISLWRAMNARMGKEFE